MLFINAVLICIRTYLWRIYNMSIVHTYGGVNVNFIILYLAISLCVINYYNLFLLAIQ